MRRALLATALTIAGLVVLLSYRTPATKLRAANRAAQRSGTFTGPAVPATQAKQGYRFGIVRVQITMRGGRIVAVDTPTLPPDGDTGRHGTYAVTTSLSNFAVPILRREALRSQGATIHTVSGATYTSIAFAQSLQGAIAAAKR